MRQNPDKGAYRKAVTTKLRKLRSQINLLEKQVTQAEADIAVRYEQKMDQIRGQYAQVKEKLEELGSSSETAWVGHKPELDRAIDQLSEAVEMMARQFTVREQTNESPRTNIYRSKKRWKVED